MMDDTEVILKFEDWLRRTKQINQEGLYAYLIAEVILLVFNASGSAFSIFLSLVGLLLSVLWLFMGLRQRKFQGMLDIELEKHLLRLFPNDIDQAKFPTYHVRRLRNGGRVGIYELNCCEQLLGSGELAWILPVFVLAANLVSFSLTVWAFTDIYTYHY
jgi:hypothetical protein